MFYKITNILDTTYAMTMDRGGIRAELWGGANRIRYD